MSIKEKGPEERKYLNAWRRRFGSKDPRAMNALNALATLYRRRTSETTRAFSAWQRVWRSVSGALENDAELIVATREFASWGVRADGLTLDEAIFVLQTYVAQTILAVVECEFQFSSDDLAKLFGPSPFDWGAEARKTLEVDLSDLDKIGLETAVARALDPFANIYQRYFSRDVRELLGEFYTPPQIARYMRAQALAFAGTDARILDPTCGAGVFLTSAARAELRRDDVCEIAIERASRTLDKLTGADVSALAVLSARANLLYVVTTVREPSAKVNASTYASTRRALWSEIAKRREHEAKPLLPIYLWDALLDETPLPPEFDLGSSAYRNMRNFDVALGNPPWITWDKLSAEYREKTKDLWRRYGLFDLSAKDSLYGGAKKELAGLVVYATLDRRLKSDGVASFVLPRSLFQKGKAGESFRRFGEQFGSPFALLALDDMTDLDLFPSVTSRPTVFFARKGMKTQYPVALRKWSQGEDRWQELDADELETPRREAVLTLLQDLNTANFVRSDPRNPERKRMTTRVYAGEVLPSSSSPGAILSFELFPSDKRTAATPFIAKAGSEQDRLVESLFERAQATGSGCAYTAQLGANAAGASGVFWLRCVDDLSRPLVKIENLFDSGKRKVERVEALVESELLYPLLRWREIEEYELRRSTTYMLLPQDPETRQGFSVETMEAKYPRALDYLRRFETALRERAAYRRYQHRAPYWSTYNVNEATFAPYKVAWRRMDAYMRAAVLTPDPKTGKPIVPQDTLSMVAVGSLTEARYLCAVLNSAPARELFDSVAVAGSKSFGSPSMLGVAPIPQFNDEDPVCMELAENCPVRIGNEEESI